MDSISLPSDDGLCMKERAIFVTKFNPLLPLIFDTKHFFLEKDVIVFMLQFFFKEGVSNSVNSHQITLDALESIFNMFLPFENILEDFVVESDGVFLNLCQSRGSVVILGCPRTLH